MAGATPENSNLGTNDQSGGGEVVGNESRPPYCPLFPLYTKKGPEGSTYVTPSQFNKLFDAGSLEDGYAGVTLATELTSVTLGASNNSVIHRVVPDDAKTSVANIIIGLEIVPVTFFPPLRDNKGGTIKDASGDITLDTVTIDGYATRLVEYSSDTAVLGVEALPGNLTGDWVPSNKTVGGTSVLIPFLQLKATSYGTPYNGIGFSFSNVPQTTTELNGSKEMLFNFKTFDKVRGLNKLRKTITNDASVKFSMYDNESRDYITNGVLGFIKQMDQAYKEKFGNLTIEDFEVTAFEPERIRTGLAGIVTLEETYISATSQTWDDGLPGVNEEWYDLEVEIGSGNKLLLPKLIDFLSFKTTKNVQFQYVQYLNVDIEASLDLVPSGIDVKLMSPVPHKPSYMSYGLDGTLDQINLEIGVNNLMDEYENQFSKYQNTALNPETNIIDFNYTFETKLNLAKFTAFRDNTAVSFSTEIVGVTTYNTVSISEFVSIEVPTFTPQVGELTDGERLGIAEAINARMKLYIESEVYSTDAFRYNIVMGSGKIASKRYGKRVGQNYELSRKLTDYMGAADGHWREGKSFDIWPGSRVKYLEELDPIEVSPALRDSIWTNNLIFTDPKTLSPLQHFITASQTGYDDDSSVLNNLLVMQAKLTLSYYNDDVWREVSGSARMSRNRLKEFVTRKLVKKIQGKFDGSFVITPRVYFTADDLTRNNSWHVEIVVYAGTLKTKQYSTITTKRIEELEG